MDYASKHKKVIDMVLEMRLCKGSECLLAPYYGYDYVCSIEVLRTPTKNEHEWRKAVTDLWQIWSSLTDFEGNKGKYMILCS